MKANRVRRYDAERGCYVYDIGFSNQPEQTPRTMKVGEAFGLGLDTHRHQLYDDFELRLTPGDVVYITGTRITKDAHSILLIKTDADGNVTWIKTFDFNDLDEAYCVREIVDGYIIAGRTRQGTISKTIVIKTDLNGETIWSKTIGDSTYESTQCIIELPQDNLLVGESTAKGSSNTDLVLTHITSEGDIIRRQYIGAHQTRLDAGQIQKTMII